MHEMSIVQSLADGIRQHLPPGASLVRAVVEVGSLEHLDEDVMRSAWDAVSMAPPLEGAALAGRHVPVSARCRHCDHGYAPEVQAYLACPRCGEARPDVLAGWGVTLRTLEADVPPDPGKAEAPDEDPDRNHKER